MAYNFVTDFMALVRNTAGGARTVRAPTLDVVIATLARANMFALYVGATAPTANQATTVWLKPATQSWSAEGVVYLWNAADAQYELATPKLFSALIAAQGV